MVEEIKVRPLIVTDVFAVARMLSKITKGAKKELTLALSDKEKSDPMEVGIIVFQSLFTETEEDLKAWLADLVGKTKDEFSIMSATTVIDIVEVLMEQEDIKDFFGRVSKLASKIGL